MSVVLYINITLDAYRKNIGSTHVHLCIPLKLFARYVFNVTTEINSPLYTYSLTFIFFRASLLTLTLILYSSIHLFLFYLFYFLYLFIYVCMQPYISECESRARNSRATIAS
jgi:hypothetical protein